MHTLQKKLRQTKSSATVNWPLRAFFVLHFRQEKVNLWSIFIRFSFRQLSNCKWATKGLRHRIHYRVPAISNCRQRVLLHLKTKWGGRKRKTMTRASLIERAAWITRDNKKGERKKETVVVRCQAPYKAKMPKKRPPSQQLKEHVRPDGRGRALTVVASPTSLLFLHIMRCAIARQSPTELNLKWRIKFPESFLQTTWAGIFGQAGRHRDSATYSGRDVHRGKQQTATATSVPRSAAPHAMKTLRLCVSLYI